MNCGVTRICVYVCHVCEQLLSATCADRKSSVSCFHLHLYVCDIFLNETFEFLMNLICLFIMRSCLLACYCLLSDGWLCLWFLVYVYGCFVCLWLPVYVYGCLCMSMVACVCLWLPICVYGCFVCLWLPVYVNGCMRAPMVACRSLCWTSDCEH